MTDYLKRAVPAATGAEKEIRDTVSAILPDVERDGLAAVRRWSQRLDSWDPPSFRVRPEEVERTLATVDPEVRAHIDLALEQVRGFARRQRDTLGDLDCEPRPGVVPGHRHIPVDGVGSYSPGGRYPMIASSITTVAVPKVAGVARVVACAPPRDGHGIHPRQLYAMAASGADELYCFGGVQALAALAFGIDGPEPVDMVVGAGNAYVAEAKRQLFGTVGIDLLTGPTEVLVIADDSADAELVAVDLLGQAEHGPTSPAILVTDSEQLARAVLRQVERIMPSWPTRDVTEEAWQRRGEVIVCDSPEEMAQVADRHAPEHLEVHARNLDWYQAHLRDYGSLFLGERSTVAYGDKAIGVNHVLPTGRAARCTGGLWVGKSLNTATYQRVEQGGTRAVAEATAGISSAELMAGHALTATYRLERFAEQEPASAPTGGAR